MFEKCRKSQNIKNVEISKILKNIWKCQTLFKKIERLEKSWKSQSIKNLENKNIKKIYKTYLIYWQVVENMKAFRGKK